MPTKTGNYMDNDNFIFQSHIKDSSIKMAYGCFNKNKSKKLINNIKPNKYKNPLVKLNFYTKKPNENISSNIFFDVHKFIHKKINKKIDPVEEINNLYKSIALEDESLLDRAASRDYKLYGNLKYQNCDHDHVSTQEKCHKSRANEKKSIYSRKSAIPDAIADDMANRKNGLCNRAENEIEKQQKYYLNHPNPTSADYLRTRIREDSLTTVKTLSDVELSQILFDDMAYRKLRKDSDFVRNPFKKYFQKELV